jgi:hypothetical protein
MSHFFQRIFELKLSETDSSKSQLIKDFRDGFGLTLIQACLQVIY